MILSAHFLVGAAVATKIGNPFWGAIAALLSHYFFDLFPAWEYNITNIYARQWRKSFWDFSKVFFDIFTGVLIFLFFFKDLFLGALGGFFAMVPDALTLLMIVFEKNGVLQWHYRIHKNFNYFKNKKIPPLLGITAEILIYLIAIFLLQQS
ncbi:MAG: hypothetical protein HY443_02110 [Candidatus Nealsonbacteria bacterium]|nr:hypothetical protein [Candidatus Nealsonbacteria bacterium]